MVDQERRTNEFTYSVEDGLTPIQQAISIMLQKYQDLEGGRPEAPSQVDMETAVLARRFAEYLLINMKDFLAEIVEAERTALIWEKVKPKG
jgi:hypothetical protein